MKIKTWTTCFETPFSILDFDWRKCRVSDCTLRVPLSSKAVQKYERQLYSLFDEVDDFKSGELGDIDCDRSQLDLIVWLEDESQNNVLFDMVLAPARREQSEREKLLAMAIKDDQEDELMGYEGHAEEWCKLMLEYEDDFYASIPEDAQDIDFQSNAACIPADFTVQERADLYEAVAFWFIEKWHSDQDARHAS